MGSEMCIRDRVRGDEDRVRWFLERTNANTVHTWFESAELVDTPISTSARPIPCEDLVEAVIRDGGYPLRVDMTERLPKTIRDAGWHAVKVLVRGYQPLRMDESIASTIVSGRIGDMVTSTPHPLI